VVVQVGTPKDFGLYNKPAGCGTSGGISYRYPILKKIIWDYFSLREDFHDDIMSPATANCAYFFM
jgi:hypothetical protein